MNSWISLHLGRNSNGYMSTYKDVVLFEVKLRTVWFQDDVVLVFLGDAGCDFGRRCVSRTTGSILGTEA